MPLKKKSVRKPSKIHNRTKTVAKRSKIPKAPVIDERLQRIKAAKTLPLELRVLGVFDMPLVEKVRPGYYSKKRSRIGFFEKLDKVLSSKVHLWVLVGLLVTSLVIIPQTRAYFSHETTVPSIELSTGKLTTNLSPEHVTFTGLSPATTDSALIEFANTGSLPFVYTIQTTHSTSSEPSLCDFLMLSADDTTQMAIGAMSSFTVSPTSLDSGTTQWTMTASLPSTTPDSLQGSSCEFILNFHAVSQNAEDDTEGFSDTRTIQVTATAGIWSVGNPAPFEQPASTTEESVITDITSTTPDTTITPDQSIIIDTVK